jgi:hypothetical protein
MYMNGISHIMNKSVEHWCFNSPEHQRLLLLCISHAVVLWQITRKYRIAKTVLDNNNNQTMLCTLLHCAKYIERAQISYVHAHTAKLLQRYSASYCGAMRTSLITASTTNTATATTSSTITPITDSNLYAIVSIDVLY